MPRALGPTPLGDHRGPCHLAFLVSSDGLAFFGVSALVFGTVAFVGGRAARFLSTFVSRRG